MTARAFVGVDSFCLNCQTFSVSTQANSVHELFSLEGGIMKFFMVSVGAFILMIKPPQVLKNLVTA